MNHHLCPKINIFANADDKVISSLEHEQNGCKDIEFIHPLMAPTAFGAFLLFMFLH